MTRLPFALLGLAALAPAALADDAVALRLQPGAPEAYEHTVTLEGRLEVGLRKKWSGYDYSTRLTTELVVTAEQPLQGAWPVEVSIAAATGRFEGISHGVDEPEKHEADYTLPDERAGFGSGWIVQGTGHAASQARNFPFQRLPGAPRGLQKRAAIDYHTTTLFNMGVLPGDGRDEWVGTSGIVVGGGGPEDDYVGLAIEEQYRVVERTPERVVITASFKELRLGDGPWFKFDQAKFEEKGRVPADRWIQACFLLPEQRTVSSERRIVFDPKSGRVIEATASFELKLTHEGKTSRVKRTDALKHSPMSTAPERIAKAQAANRPLVYDLDADTQVVRGGAVAERVHLQGRLQAQRRQDSGVWAVTFQPLSATVTLPDAEEAAVKLPQYALLGGRLAARAVMFEGALHRAYQAQVPKEHHAALALVHPMVKAALPVPLEQGYPWILPGVVTRDEPKLNVLLMHAYGEKPGLRQTLAGAIPVQVRRTGPGALELEAEDASGDTKAGTLSAKLTHDEETKRLTTYEGKQTLDLGGGATLTHTVRWTRVVKTP